MSHVERLPMSEADEERVIELLDSIKAHFSKIRKEIALVEERVNQDPDHAEFSEWLTCLDGITVEAIVDIDDSLAEAAG